MRVKEDGWWSPLHRVRGDFARFLRYFGFGISFPPSARSNIGSRCGAHFPLFYAGFGLHTALSFTL